MEHVAELPRAVEVTEHLEIPVADGTRLAARLWLPEGAETEPVPAVLEYIPYRKRDLTRSRDALHHPYLAGHGYACLRVDLRGSGDSQGVLTDEYLGLELDDGCDVIAWIAAQSWCDGNVGMMGISWGGFNALQIAERQPPALGAVAAVAATDDRYTDDVHYMGGCLLGDNLSWASVMFSYNTLPPDPELVDDWRERWFQRLEGSGLWLDTWLRHPHRDHYWRHGSVTENISAIEVPVMAVSGWADGYTNAVFRLLEGLDVPRHGLVGPWSHKYPHIGVPGPAIDWLGELVRWWDRWLKGIDNGVEQEPDLRAWMQDSVAPFTIYDRRPGRWISEPVWPSKDTNWRTWSFTSRRLLPLEEAGEISARPGGPRDPDRSFVLRSPLSVGLFAGKWCSYAGAPDLPGDQQEEDGGALTFDTEPLTEAVEILGSPAIELELTSGVPVAMLAVRLSDVRPDRQVGRVTYGLLNLTHRDGHEQPEPLEPGERVRVRVELNHVAQIFPAGHRIRVSISSSYWPLAWLPPELAQLEVFPASGRLHLPARPRRDDEPVVEFEAPEAAPPEPRVQEVAPESSWRVVRDLGTNASTLEVVKDEGTYWLEDIDLRVRSRAVERYTVVGADAGSARGEAVWERELSRGDWRIRTRTSTLLTCDRDFFHIDASLDAFEGESRVYSRNWDESIERRLV